MEPLFQIRSRTDFATLGRLYRYLFFFAPRNLWLNGIYLFLCSFAATFFFLQGEIFSGCVIVLCFLLFVFLMLLRCYLTYSAHKKRILESHQSDRVDSSYEVYPDAICAVDSTGATTRLFYANVRYAKDRPEEIFLFTKAKLLYVLPKNGFTRGTPEELLTFLQSRLVKVKS